MEILRTYWNNTKEMPRILGMLCQGGMVAAPILFLLIIFPISDYRVNGRQISYLELWSSGIGIVTAVLLSLVIIGTWGLAARKPNSRWALVFAAIGPATLALAVPELRTSYSPNIVFFLQILIFAVIIYGYLFHFPSVQKYLQGEEHLLNHNYEAASSLTIEDADPNIFKKLYQYRKYLIVLFIGFGAAFALTIYLNIEAGNSSLQSRTVYLALSYWWLAIVSLYMYWLVDTLHGKLKDKSISLKVINMIFPTIFVMMAIYVTTKFISAA